MTTTLKSPVNCHLWKKRKLEPEDLYSAFEVMETYIEDSHYFRKLLKCKDCGQLYFYEFYEEIDWADGNDPQYTIYLPVGTKEEIELLKNTSLFGLSAFYPNLRKDFPKEADKPKVFWVGK